MLLLNKAQFEEFDVFARVTEFKLIENLGTSSFSGTGVALTCLVWTWQ
jgi:hypothetical protein